MITPYKEEEVLGFYEERILDEGDFDIDDIKDSLQDFLTNEELKEIKGETDNKSKIQKLFFILIYHKKKLSDFLNILHGPYQWLAEGLKWALDTRTTHSNVVIDTFRRAIREIPKNDFIVHRCGFVSIPRKYLYICHPSIHSSLILALANCEGPENPKKRTLSNPAWKERIWEKIPGR